VTVKRVQLLSRRQFALVYGIAIAVFFLANGPVWRHPFDLDRAILWSYLVIPVLVAGCLLASRAFGLLSLLYNSVEAVIVKFGITYVAATILWMLSGAPPSRAAQADPPPRPAAVAAPPSGPAVLVENRGAGFGSVEVRVDQPLSLRATDGRLHTFRVYDADGAVVLNQAVPPGGPVTIALPEPLSGTVGCAVHPDEPRGSLAVR
jgi:hypothetical protein